MGKDWAPLWTPHRLIADVFRRIGEGTIMVSRRGRIILPKNKFLPHPGNGGLAFGIIPEMSHSGLLFHEGEIRLRFGQHSGPNRGFGAVHIWEEHRKEMSRHGLNTFEDVPAFVALIVRASAAVFCEFNAMKGLPRLTIVRGGPGKAILEQKPSPDGHVFYSVVTAYADTKAHGTRIGTVR